MEDNYDVVVIGGGLAGLVSAGILASNGYSVSLIEKGSYPRNKVCGEFMCLESEPAIRQMGVSLFDLSPIKIDHFTLSTVHGKTAKLNLPQPGIGISRYKLEEVLYKRLLELGVDVLCKTMVEKVERDTAQDKHLLLDQNGKNYWAKVVVGAYGKRSILQLPNLNRSGYFGAKNYYRFPLTTNEVQLHIFPSGYAGMSNVENGLVNFCYLGKTSDLKKCGGIEAYQKQIVSQNPFLKRLLNEGEPMLDKTLTISQIDFGHRKRVTDGMLHVGDAGGVIHPLSGNGMSMALKSAQILSQHVQRFLAGEITRTQLESAYSKSWEKAFRIRMISSKFYQALFENSWGSNLAVVALRNKTLGKRLIKLTQGKPKNYITEVGYVG